VALSVYELHGTSALNFATSLAGMGGAYHVGVEVYGLEWSYGGADLGTGVYPVHIGQSSLGNFHSRVPLGRTRKSAEEVLKILDDMRRKWWGPDYSLLTHNCTHFSVEFTKRLGFTNQPEWINSLAAYGAGVTGAQAQELAEEREVDNLDVFDDDEVEDMAADGDHIAMLEMVFRQSKEYTLEHVDKAKHDARYEDLLVEFRWAVPRDDEKQRGAALSLMRDARLKKAVAEATASALGLRWDRTSEEDLCPVTVDKYNTLSNLRISSSCRVTGGDNTRRIQRKPQPEDFAKGFKLAMKSQSWLQKNQKAVMETLRMDTAPGQPAAGRRVLSCSKTGGGEIYFAKREFKTPDSVHRTLAKLQQLRVSVQEQSVVHRTLKAMHRPVAAPWWAS